MARRRKELPPHLNTCRPYPAQGCTASNAQRRESGHKAQGTYPHLGTYGPTRLLTVAEQGCADSYLRRDALAEVGLLPVTMPDRERETVRRNTRRDDGGRTFGTSPPTTRTSTKLNRLAVRRADTTVEGLTVLPPQRAAHAQGCNERATEPACPLHQRGIRRDARLDRPAYNSSRDDGFGAQSPSTPAHRPARSASGYKVLHTSRLYTAREAATDRASRAGPVARTTAA